MTRLLIAATTALALASSAALAQTPAAPVAAPARAPAPPIGAPLSLEQARAAMAAAMAEARRSNFAMAIAIVEPSGALVAFERMDGTQYGSLEVAQDKARSAAWFRRPTAVFDQAVSGGAAELLSLRGAVAIEGGVPLVVGGRLVGAIGVSGASSQQDGVVAAAGAAALARP